MSFLSARPPRGFEPTHAAPQRSACVRDRATGASDWRLILLLDDPIARSAHAVRACVSRAPWPTLQHILRDAASAKAAAVASQAATIGRQPAPISAPTWAQLLRRASSLHGSRPHSSGWAMGSIRCSLGPGSDFSDLMRMPSAGPTPRHFLGSVEGAPCTTRRCIMRSNSRWFQRGKRDDPLRDAICHGTRPGRLRASPLRLQPRAGGWGPANTAAVTHTSQRRRPMINGSGQPPARAFSRSSRPSASPRLVHAVTTMIHALSNLDYSMPRGVDPDRCHRPRRGLVRPDGTCQRRGLDCLFDAIGLLRSFMPIVPTFAF